MTLPPPAASPSAKPTPQLWTFFLAAFPVLLFFTWAGSSTNPQTTLPWTWTPSGWIAPAPSLTFVWIAATLLFATLSMLGWRLTDAEQRPALITTFTIFGLAALIRLIIARLWTPLPLEDLTFQMPPNILGQMLAMAADLLALATLQYALHVAGRSPYYALLYAFHPLPLLVITAAPRIAIVSLPILVLVILANRPHRLLTLGLNIAASLAAIIATAVYSNHEPFNSLLTAMLNDYSLAVSPGARIITLTALQIVLQTALVAVAVRRNWSFGRTLLHVATLFLLTCPAVYPWQLLPPLILLPLFWCRAAWILSFTVLTAYAAAPLYSAAHSPTIPTWLLLLEWLPVWAVEIDELAMGT